MHMRFQELTSIACRAAIISSTTIWVKSQRRSCHSKHDGEASHWVATEIEIGQAGSSSPGAVARKADRGRASAGRGLRIPSAADNRDNRDAHRSIADPVALDVLGPAALLSPLFGTRK